MIAMPKLDADKAETMKDEELSAHAKKKHKKSIKKKRKRSRRARAREREEEREENEKKKKIVFIALLASFILYGIMNPSSVPSDEASSEEEQSQDQEILSSSESSDQKMKKDIDKILPKYDENVQNKTDDEKKRFKPWLVKKDATLQPLVLEMLKKINLTQQNLMVCINSWRCY